MITNFPKKVYVTKAVRRKIKYEAKTTINSKNVHVFLFEPFIQLGVSEEHERYDHLDTVYEKILIAQSDEEDNSDDNELSDGNIFDALIYFVTTTVYAYCATSLDDYELAINGKWNSCSSNVFDRACMDTDSMHSVFGKS